MELFLRVDINIVSMFVLGSVFGIASKRLDKKDKLNQTFLKTSVIILIEVFLETFTFIIDKQPLKGLAFVSAALNTCLFILGPFVPYLWCVFVHRWIFPEVSVRRKVIPLLLPFFLNFIIIVANLFTGMVFSVSSMNEYHRGPLFVLPVAAAYFYLFYCFAFIIKNKKKIMRDVFAPLLLFGMFPALAGLIEALFYGALLFWSSAALSFSIVFIFIQQRMMQFDTLTGAWTKGTFEHYINTRLGHDKFGIVFIDLDGFKRINDICGHMEGDLALKQTVKLIRESLRKSDIIARFGGDEFVLLIETVSNDEIKKIMARIQEGFTQYNKSVHKPYALKYSFGYDIFDPSRHTIERFINHVDSLMYMNKERKRVERDLKPS